jgi:hypothetical protein
VRAIGTEPAKIIVQLDAHLTVEVVDDGYLGTNMSVDEHLKRARDQAEQWGYLVQKGSLEPVRARASVKVVSLTIVPKEL